jgi:hypothetical protein
MGGVQIRPETLIVSPLYFIGYYLVHNIIQRLLGPWLGINLWEWAIALHGRVTHPSRLATSYLCKSLLHMSE